MKSPAFARYIAHVALPRAIAYRAANAEQCPHRCTACNAPMRRKRAYCDQCRYVDRECVGCGVTFEVDRGEARQERRRFCGTSCSQTWVKRDGR